MICFQTFFFLTRQKSTVTFVFDVGTFVGNKRPTRLLCYERKFFLSIKLNKNAAKYKNSQARERTGSELNFWFFITLAGSEQFCL